MRRLSKVMIGLLLGVTMGTPIAVQAQESGRSRGGGGGGDRGGRQRGGGDSGGGAQRGGGDAGQRGGSGGDRGAMMNARREAVQQARETQRQVERPAPVARAQATPSPDRPQWRGDRGNGGANRVDERGREARIRPDRPDMVVGNAERRRWDGNRDNDRRDGNRDGDRRTWGRDRDRDGDRDGNRNWSGDRRDWNRDGHRDWNRDGNRSWSSDRRDWDRRDNRRWDRDWRNDQRYSWRDYRTRNRNIYRMPRYEAHHGYSYRRWYAGHRWEPWFYSSAYWISDPWQYRLPPAYGPYRWVRYYDDVVLVDTDTGEIVDIIYGFFW